MFRRLQTLAISASALWVLSSAVPADPTITAAAVLPRQNSDSFIGFLEQNNTWTSVNCELFTSTSNSGLTWYQSGQYAQCCPASLPSCYAATACVGGSQIYTYPDISSATTIACTDNYNNAALSICNTIFIYENTQDSNPRTNINCGDQSQNWSYYRDIGTSKTGEVDTSPSTSMPQPPSTTNVEPASTSEPDSGSNAWIAGAVIGPILGLALVGFGVWFFLRRRKKAALAPQQGTASMVPIDPSQPPVGVGGHTDAKPQFAPAQPTYYNHLGQPDPYAQQGYPEQGGFSPPQGSPAPQYGFQQSAYNATAALLPPGTHSQYAKYEGGTAELGGDSTGVAPAAPGSVQQNLAPTSQAAELSGVDTQSHGEVLPGGKQQ